MYSEITTEQTKKPKSNFNKKIRRKRNKRKNLNKLNKMKKNRIKNHKKLKKNNNLLKNKFKNLQKNSRKRNKGKIRKILILISKGKSRKCKRKMQKKLKF